jgi:hypothetical protein
MYSNVKIQLFNINIAYERQILLIININTTDIYIVTKFITIIVCRL